MSSESSSAAPSGFDHGGEPSVAAREDGFEHGAVDLRERDRHCLDFDALLFGVLLVHPDGDMLGSTRVHREYGVVPESDEPIFGRH